MPSYNLINIIMIIVMIMTMIIMVIMIIVKFRGQICVFVGGAKKRRGQILASCSSSQIDVLSSLGINYNIVNVAHHDHHDQHDHHDHLNHHNDDDC